MSYSDEQTHYEILELPLEASSQHVERAYRVARATYQPGSAATYSLLSDEESAEMLRKVETAYAVLSDARLRKEYDTRLRTMGQTLRAVAAPVEPRPGPTLADRIASEPRAELEDIAPPEDGVYDGEVLRRMRMSRGIELEEIAHLTKISRGHLQNIEADRYDLLPAPVYLRGFLREIARCLRLDPQLVADSYMGKQQAHKAGGKVPGSLS